MSGHPAAAVGSIRSVQKPGPAFRTPGAMLARNHGSAQPTVPATLTILSPNSGNTASKKVRKFDPTTPIQTSGKLDPTTPVTQIPDKKPPVIIGQLGPKPNPGTPVITGNPDPVNGTPDPKTTTNSGTPVVNGPNNPFPGPVASSPVPIDGGAEIIGAPVPTYVPRYVPRAVATDSPAPRSTPPAASCFRKNYLPDGGMVLIDECTKQQVTVVPGGNTCLQTQDAQAGSVWFADKCGKQQVLAPPAASMEALSLIYKRTGVSRN